MSDKTDAQIEQEKVAVAAMHNAKANMQTAINRIATLEGAIIKLQDSFRTLRYHVGQQSVIESGGVKMYLPQFIDEQIAIAAKVLP